MLSDDDITVKAMLISQTPGIGISTLWSAIFDGNIENFVQIFIYKSNTIKIVYRKTNL